MSEPYFKQEYKTTSYNSYCPECDSHLISLVDDDFVDCFICGKKLENFQVVVNVFQDPKYTTVSC